YYHKNSLKLAQMVNNEFGAIGLENRGVEVGDFLVIRDIKEPAILLEMGYINSDRDFDQIISKSYRTTVVNDVYQGLEKYFAAQKDTNK
ncbi:MAG: N-acetylmuramoyl-L-alanine amidase, partial [Ligilactobacillus sp.]|nr:N-acetylmuramoyl-L-alanine amidase [Ligilactobacillus sp.]